MQLNPGHILPVYTNLQSQHCYQTGCEAFNWAIPFDATPTFQFPVQTGANGQWTWEVHTSDGSSFVLEDHLLKYSQNTANTKAWLQYDGDGQVLGNVAAPSDCIYWFKIRHNSGTEYFTERFKVLNLNDGIKTNYKLQFYNSVDLGGILYQGGYVQHVLLTKAVFDTPETVENNETEVNGNAVEVLSFQSLQKRLILKFPYFPDFWQGVFQRLKTHNNVTLTRMDTDENYTLNGNNIEFGTEEQDECFRIGVLSWTDTVRVTNFCEENEPMSILNNVQSF